MRSSVALLLPDAFCYNHRYINITNLLTTHKNRPKCDEEEKSLGDTKA
jgi:hypothetical protein